MSPEAPCMSSQPPWPTCLRLADLVQAEPLECGACRGSMAAGFGGERSLPDSKNNLPHWTAAPNIFYGFPAPWPDASACSLPWSRPSHPPTCPQSLEMGVSAPCLPSLPKGPSFLGLVNKSNNNDNSSHSPGTTPRQGLRSGSHVPELKESSRPPYGEGSIHR